jgi:chromosome segregation ATPase
MKTSLRSHGFDKPSDLDDHLAELDEEAAEKEAEKPAVREARASATVDQSIRAELDELRKQLEKLRRDVKKLESASHPTRHKPTDIRHEKDHAWTCRTAQGRGIIAPSRPTAARPDQPRLNPPPD